MTALEVLRILIHICSHFRRFSSYFVKRPNHRCPSIVHMKPVMMVWMLSSIDRNSVP